MPPPVRVDFTAGGIGKVKEAILSIEKALIRLESVQGRSTRSRTASHARSADEITRIEGRAVDARLRQTEKGARAEERVEEKKQQTIAREQQRAAAQSNRIKEARMRDVERWADREIRADQRVSREREKLLARETRDRQMANRHLARGIGGSMSSAAGSSLSGMGRTGFGFMNSVMNAGGGFNLSDAVHTSMSNEKSAVGLYNSVLPDQRKDETGKKISPLELQRRAKMIAIKTGVPVEDVLGGIRAYSGLSGHLDNALQNAETYTKWSMATGASLEDVQKTGAMMDLKKLPAAEAKDVMRNLIAQSMTGAVEMRDIAAYAPRLMAPSRDIEGGLGKNMRMMGALAQMSVDQGFAGTAAEASMSAMRVHSDIGKKAKLFKSEYNIDVIGKSGKMRDIGDILAESMVATKGNQTKLQGLYGAYSYRLAGGLKNVFMDATGGKTDKASLAMGDEAVRKELKRYTGSDISEKELDDSAAREMATNAGKIAIATENFRASVDANLMPQIAKLVELLTSVIPTLAKWMEFFSNSPWSSLLAIMGVKLAADIGMAGVGRLVGEAITRSILASTGGAGAGGAPIIPVPNGRGGVGKARQGGEGAGAYAGPVAFAAAAGLAMVTNEQMAEGQGEGGAAKFLAGMKGDAAAVTAGTMDPRQAAERAERAKQMIEGSEAGSSSFEMMRSVMANYTSSADPVVSALGGDTASDITEDFARNREIAKNKEEFNAALVDLTKAIQKSSGAITNQPNRSGAPMPAIDPNHSGR